MNNKKSSLFFLPLLIIISLVILINLYIVLLSKNEPLKYPIGQRQFDLLRSYIKAESALFYIDQSAKYSLQQAVYELAQNGGIVEVGASDTAASEGNSLLQTTDECGKYYGYTLWYVFGDGDSKNNMANCLNENYININLEYIFNENLNQYLINHPNNIPLDNYDYESQGSLEIIGKAIEPLKFDILKEESKQIAKEPIKTPEGLTDFTGTEMCAKGSRCVLTEDAYKLLQEAQKKAEEKEVGLEVYSAYRTPKEQQALWEGKTAERYAQRYPNELERALYVCNPSNGEKACPHMTGNVVDVRFKGKTAQLMTWQDWRLLHEIMSESGWVRYAKENWHFECCGTVRYAKAQAKGVTETA